MNDNITAFALGGFVIFIFMIAFGLKNAIPISYAHKQAVLHHAGHWEPDAEGNPTFHWNDETTNITSLTK